MKKADKTILFNPIIDPERVHRYRNVRWVENVSDGLRLVGFADEIARNARRRSIEHRGWFTEDDGINGDTYRGVVYRLPARDGHSQYVYGYADPNNDDCALLCFDVETDGMDAALAADRFAEIFADEARDYNRAWQAGRQFEELAEEVQAMRKEALAIGAEMRAAKKASLIAPTICATLRSKIASLYRSIQKARAKRAELHDNFGSCDGFTNG